MKRIAILAWMMLLALPATAFAQGEPEAEAPADQPDGDIEAEPLGEVEPEPEPAPLDPLTQRLTDIVGRYYSGVGIEPTAQEMADGIQSIQLMLLDGVSLARIEVAVDEAIRLHQPGRRVPFAIAVPLRVRPGDDRAEPDQVANAAAAHPEVAATPQEPPRSERAEALRQQRDQRRQRMRLYRQWRERLKPRRTLLTMGVPMLAGSYAAGFAIAGGMYADGTVPHSSAWVAAVPLVGTMILGIWTENEVAGLYVLTGFQMAGAGLIVAAFAQKIDWPHDKDPTALRIGRHRRGGPAVTIQAVPTGGGGLLVGTF